MNNKLFKVDYNKEKYIYYAKRDGTSLDKFVNKVRKELEHILLDISIKGIKVGKNDFYFKQLPYGFEQKGLYWEAKNIDRTKTRQYYMKIYLDWDKMPFRICNMNWVSSVDETLKTGTSEDFYYNRDLAFKLIEKLFKKHTKYFVVSTFCGILPQSSWYARLYIKVIFELQITGFDIIVHSGNNNLTDFGLNHIKEIRNEFALIVNKENIPLSELYINHKKRYSIVRKAENSVRKKYRLKNVGDTYINETILANYVKTIFPDTVRQYNTRWLGKFLLDIYIPSLRIAIEYHGEQHYKPIKRFGGEEKHIQQQQRDEFVRQQCKKNNVLLLEWHYEQKVTESNVYEFLSKHIDISKSKRVLTLF